MPPRRLVPTLAAGALLALAGCGGGSGEGASSTAGSATLPFPPTAFEPGTGPQEDGVPGEMGVRTGGRAEGVAVDPQTRIAAVGVKGATGGGDVVVLLDTRTGRVTQRVRVPSAPRHIVLAQSGGPFLVPAEDANALAQIDPRTGRSTVTQDVGDHPHDATWLDGDAYVADEFSGTVSKVHDGDLVRRRPVDVQPGGIRAVGDQLAVISVRAYTVELLDGRTLDPEGSQNVGYGPSHVVTDGSRLYIADTRGNGISVFDTKPQLRFAARVPVPDSPYGMAIDTRRKRLWVTRTAANAVAEIDLSGRTPRVVRSIPTVQQPNTVGVDEASGRLVIASATDGVVQLLDP